MANPTLQTALMGADGRSPARITRIEIEILDSQCRWTLWSEARRLFSRIARANDLPAMLRDTGKILQTEMAARRGAN